MVTTIAAMDMIAKALERKIRTIQANSKEEYDEQVEKVKESIMSLMGQLRNLNPLLLPMVVANDEDLSQDKKNERINDT